MNPNDFLKNFNANNIQNIASAVIALIAAIGTIVGVVSSEVDLSSNRGGNGGTVSPVAPGESEDPAPRGEKILATTQNHWDRDVEIDTTVRLANTAYDNSIKANERYWNDRDQSYVTFPDLNKNYLQFTGVVGFDQNVSPAAGATRGVVDITVGNKLTKVEVNLKEAKRFTVRTYQAERVHVRFRVFSDKGVELNPSGLAVGTPTFIK